MGGIALLAGFFGTWQNLKVAQISSDTSQKALLVSQQGQITDRFTKAIEQLGAVDAQGVKKMVVPLGVSMLWNGLPMSRNGITGQLWKCCVPTFGTLLRSSRSNRLEEALPFLNIPSLIFRRSSRFLADGIANTRRAPKFLTSAAQISAGQTSTGHTSTGQTSAGHTSPWQISAGQTCAGQTSAGHTFTGQTSSGQTSAGHTSAGQTSAGQTSAGHTSTEQTSSGQTSAGHTSTGRPSTGQTSPWHTSSG